MDPERPRAAVPRVLREHWLVLVLALALLASWLDLRREIRALRDEVRRRGVPAAAPGATSTDAGVVAPVPTGPGAPVSGPGGGSHASGSDAGATGWRCSGSLPTDAATRAVGTYGRAVFTCYGTFQRSHPGARGTVRVDILVGSDGSPREVNVGGSPADPMLRECIGNAALTWRFARPTGGDCAVVSAPFRLEPPTPH